MLDKRESASRPYAGIVSFRTRGAQPGRGRVRARWKRSVMVYRRDAPHDKGYFPAAKVGAARPRGGGRRRGCPLRPLEDIRILSRRAVRRGAVREPPPRRPRRRGDQDRGSRRGRRRRPLRAALRRGRGLALLRDLQPQQALHLARPQQPCRGRGVFEDLVRVSDAVYSNLRGDVPAKIGASATATSPTSTRGSSAARCPASG